MGFINSSLIFWVFTGIFALFVILGALWGLGRGLKKSLFRLIVVAVLGTVLLLVLPAIVKSFLKINIQGASVESHIENYAQEAAENMGTSSENMEATIQAIKTLLVLVVGSIAYSVIYFALLLLTWPICAIIQGTLLKRKPGQRKYKGWGALVGAFQGLAVCFLLFIPIGGFIRLVPTTSSSNSVSAYSVYAADDVNNGTTGSGVYKIAEVDDDTTDIISTIVDGYKKSVPGMIFGVGKIDSAFFNYLTTAKVDGVKISLSNEVNSFLPLADIVAENDELLNLVKHGTTRQVLDYLASKPEGSEETHIKTISNKAIDTLFNSGILKLAIQDSINTISDILQTTKNPDGEYYASELEVIKASKIDWKEEADNISSVIANGFIEGTHVYGFIEDNKNNENVKYSELDFESIGQVLDDFKDLNLIKKLFKPLVIYFGDQSGIFQEILEQTQEYGGGVNLRKMLNAANICYKDVFGAAKKSLVLVETIQETENIDTSNLSEVLSVLSDLPEEVKEELNNALTSVVQENIDEKYTDSISTALGYKAEEDCVINESVTIKANTKFKVTDKTNNKGKFEGCDSIEFVLNETNPENVIATYGTKVVQLTKRTLTDVELISGENSEGNIKAITALLNMGDTASKIADDEEEVTTEEIKNMLEDIKDLKDMDEDMQNVAMAAINEGVGETVIKNPEDIATLAENTQTISDLIDVANAEDNAEFDEATDKMINNMEENEDTSTILDIISATGVETFNIDEDKKDSIENKINDSSLSDTDKTKLLELFGITD